MADYDEPGMQNYAIYQEEQFIRLFEAQMKLLEVIINQNRLLRGEPFIYISDGEANNRANRRARFLDKCYIPNSIYNYIRDHSYGSLRLQENFRPDNYVQKFHNLLWIEEAHQSIEMRNYDMANVNLQYGQNLMSLTVPGLSDGRPSLREGDRIFLGGYSGYYSYDNYSHGLQLQQQQQHYIGYIHQINGCVISFSLDKRLHCEQFVSTGYDVAFVPSRTSYRRCHGSVEQFKRNNILMKDIVFPERKLVASPPIIDISAPNFPHKTRALNNYQRQAVIGVLRAECRPAPFIIFGPPGTGKTATLIEAVIQVYSLKQHSRILICGSSNACADLIAKRILKSGKVPKDEIVRVSAAYRMEKLILHELVDITKDMAMIPVEMYANYRIIITTCIQSGALQDFGDKFDYVFIDEAGHATEPETLIPIGLMKKHGCTILAGDPHQLGPICMNKTAERNGLGRSFLERLSRLDVYKRQKQQQNGDGYDGRYIAMLGINYRSDCRVMSVNNELIYEGLLEFDKKSETPLRWLRLFDTNNPLVFHQVDGWADRRYGETSWYNRNEATVCVDYAKRLYHAGLKPEQLGIVTPYRSQIDVLKSKFDELRLKECRIATVTKFQGDERHIIIISTVRDQRKDTEYIRNLFRFVLDKKRFNVSVSRAKWMVILVGDKKLLNHDSCWKKYIETAHKIN